MRVSVTPEQELFNRATINTPTPRRKGTGRRAWLVITVSGQSYLEQFGKYSIMRRTGLPARDLRILDSLLSYPLSILGRESAIVINLEHIKAIITANEILVPNPMDPLVASFVRDLQQRVSDSNVELQKQISKSNDNDAEVMDKAPVSSQFAPHYDLASTGTGISRRIHASLEISPMVYMMEENNKGPTLDRSKDGGPKVLPFEFRALEVCLESACRCLESETTALEQEAYPGLDELTSKLSTLNLERFRLFKSRLAAISGRVHKVRDELEHLLDNDMDMARMYLSAKLVDQSVEKTSSRFKLDDETLKLDDESFSDEDAETIDGKTKSTIESFAGSKLDIKELEMLLETYFLQMDGTLNKLYSMKEYADDTQDYINIMLDDKQNQLIGMGLKLSLLNFVMSMGSTAMDVFTMNIDIKLFDSTSSTWWLETVTATFGIVVLIYAMVIAWGKKKGLIA